MDALQVDTRLQDLKGVAQGYGARDLIVGKLAIYILKLFLET
jgi:hypothetical protein